MKSLIALSLMTAWSIAIYVLMNHGIGFQNHMHDWMWSIGAAIMLFIGVVGNVWIYFLIVKETPWQWFSEDDK